MVTFLIIIAIAISIWLLIKNTNQSNNEIKGIEKPVSKSKYVVFENDKYGITARFDLSFPDSLTRRPYLIVVDTETSGLRKFRSKDRKNLSNWPRILQISWLVFDDEGGMIKSNTQYFKQPRPIPLDAVQYHGITDEICREKGVDPFNVLQEFWKDCQDVEFLVGHNIKFDHDVIEANMRRFKVTDLFSMPVKCTMAASENLLQLPSNFSGKNYKSPKLSELVHFLFYPKNTKADIKSHDAEYDTLYTARCYWEMKERGLI